MADLVRLAYYPFLPEVRAAVQASGVGLDEVLTAPRFEDVRRRARERVEGSLEDGFAPARVADDRDALGELFSVAVARMLCVLIGQKVLTQRYAAAEARRVHDALARDPESLEPAAAALGLRLQAPLNAGEKGWRMHIADYLMAAPSDKDWKLILRPVHRGFVPIDRPTAQRLVQEGLERRIRQELEAEATKPVPASFEKALAPILEALGPKLDEAREKWTTGDFGPVQPGLFPPCVKWIFDELRAGKNLPHHARFAFATFLNTIGWNAEQIMDYLAATPNFDREKSRYQIEHITGQKGVDAYMVPNCSTMQTNGVCPLDQRDQICFRIKNPLSYYRKRLYMQKRDEERMGILAAPASPAGANPSSGASSQASSNIPVTRPPGATSSTQPAGPPPTPAPVRP